jgi:GNAT superfamily N-acetyltransferase
MPKTFQIRPTAKEDKPWITSVLTGKWGSSRSVSRGHIYQADELPGFVAVQKEKQVGLITYRIDGNECEITTMNSLIERKGIGTALLDAVKNVAVKAGCKRIWLVTTNDNTEALRFWQKRGFNFKAVYPNAVEKSRKLKPEIALFGDHGIPIRDEIELEMML